MSDVLERSGRVNSGDVSIFYRVYGAPGATPLLIMHGSNYFDSDDWVEVARALAGDREVCTYDKRGFGRSGWSPSKDYSTDANMDDVLAVTGALGWQRPAVMGHSSSGRLSIAFAAAFPHRLSRLIVVDSDMARGPDGRSAQRTSAPPPLQFASVEAAMAHFARLNNPPRFAHDRARAEKALVKGEGGYTLRRDPDFQNTRPQGESAGLPRGGARDVWKDLAAVRCPTLLVRGLRSDRYPPEILERLAREFPNLPHAPVNSQHDVAYGAPDELIAAVRKFLTA
jgi:pimeloyl-ACP methyl ester carboxylesterase